MSDLKHLFVPYELAVKLKEKGFDELCFGGYSVTIKSDEFDMFALNSRLHTLQKNSDFGKGVACAPLYQQVVDWFFNEHQILINPVKINSYQLFYEVESHSITCYETKEKAIEEALKLI